MMGSVLTLKKLGNDFRPGAPECTESDLENYRLQVEFTDREGQRVIGDLTRKCAMSYFGKRGQQLKNPRIIETNRLSAELSFYKDGQCYAYRTNGKEDKYNYTSKDVMAFIGELSGMQYASVEIIDPYGLGEKRKEK